MKTLVEVIRPIQQLNIIRNIIAEDGPFPNNNLLPLMLFRQAVAIEDEDSAGTVKELLETNRWTDSWVNGIYGEHHFHSTAHEVLVAMRGSARVQFGGPNGIILTFEKGDVVVIPAGVSHCRVDKEDGFSCLGAYPEGQHYDINYGKAAERPRADENIRKVPLPENDPVYGNDGPLLKNWLGERNNKEVL
jgi:uncharacterized protein YjlB